MAEDSTNTAHDEARQMLDIFASVGATRFDLTWTNSAGGKTRFRGGMSLAGLARPLPRMLDAAIADRLNLIVRPYGDSVTLMQLDDLGSDQLPRLAPAMFLIIETSPGNHQAWAALPGRHDKEFARRVRRGAGADPSASGATRLAGSRNFKPKYAPDYPRVTIRAAQPGRMTSAGELERLGLVAPPDDFAPLREAPARFAAAGGHQWPSYAVALEFAPLNRAGTGKDRSAADIGWCMTAIKRGFGIDETAARLMEESAKAREKGRGYAVLTAGKAAQYVAQRGQQPRRQQIAEHGRG